MLRAAPGRLLAAVVAFLLGASLQGCAGPGSAKSTGDKGYISGAGVITRLAVDNRKRPGPVAGTTLEGEAWSLADHRGKVVVLNVWASWCPPCRAEAPALKAAAEQLDGVEFVGIDVRDPSEDAGKAFQERFALPYPSLHDPAGKTLLAFRGTLPPNAIPSTIVIDAQGRVAALVLGEVPSKNTLVALVQDVQSR